ncbi:MAG: DEAD/DEAH box helicase family protein [Deltaproteobacteria bacterium]|nr:DEAD/DEAH box helicase family protein [Deltaproteobacteria bacterium]
MPIEESIREIGERLERTKAELARIEDEFEESLRRHFHASMWEGVRHEEIGSFVRRPYFVQPLREGEGWRLFVPRFIPLEVGWLEYQDESYNVFRVSMWVDWLKPIPDVLKWDLGLEEPPFDLQFDWEKGILSVQRGEPEAVKRKYQRFIHRRLNHGVFQVKSSQRFSFLVQLLRDGILPHPPKPANPEDIRAEEPFELRDYQREALECFMRYSHIGIFYPFGAGKSYFGVYMIGRIKGRKLVVVPTRTLIELWGGRIKELCPEELKRTEIITYHSLHKVRQREFSLVLIDEAHHAPADTFSQVFFIKRKYTIALTGSPYREDGRTELLFTMGRPVGADWSYFFKLGVVRKPSVTVVVLPKREDKLFELKRLLKEPLITLIYCDGIESGKRLASNIGCPYVFSETRHRLDEIKRALDGKGYVVLSRVGDEGVSLPAIQRIVEYDFLFGSRRQEVQRVGRLFHATEAGEHYVLMTQEELSRYKKRLYGLVEKGIEIKWDVRVAA